MNALINKYGILLSIIYLIGLILSYTDLLTGELYLIYYFITNVAVALLVSSDLKQNNIKSSIVIWSTIFFSILGVSLFLLKIMENEKKASA